ncbi:hypothetical protein [Nesterenkonia pannonica]|uniref:hypothetical protein n=1 Tax=Nesterenkonia pannonica TaxID=1548602 RepID=UPI0021643C73|nr:hypothetical protein [Nesterenkonia pannonica]
MLGVGGCAAEGAPDGSAASMESVSPSEAETVREGSPPSSAEESTPPQQQNQQQPDPVSASADRGPVPERVTIPSIGIDEPMIDLSIDSSGRLEEPQDWDDVGWFAEGAARANAARRSLQAMWTPDRPGGVLPAPGDAGG